MRWTLVLCATGLALSTAAFAQVTITGNEPVSGGAFTSPVTISAFASSPNTISGWAVYFGNTEVYSNSTGLNGVLDITVTPPTVPGNYQVTVTAWDTTGAHNSYVATNVTVNTSPMPTPPGDATLFPSLQNQSGNPGTWTVCNGSCSGSSGGSGSSNLTFSHTTPSLSHASMAETSSGASFNTLYYRHLGCTSGGCTSVSNFLDDVWFYIPAATTYLQALEFDPDVYTGTDKYFMSMQCDSASGLCVSGIQRRAGGQ